MKSLAQFEHQHTHHHLVCQPFEVPGASKIKAATRPGGALVGAQGQELQWRFARQFWHDLIHFRSVKQRSELRFIELQRGLKHVDPGCCVQGEGLQSQASVKVQPLMP